jgi:hypothetical protein
VALFEVAFFDDRGYLYLPEVIKMSSSTNMHGFIHLSMMFFASKIVI